MFKQINGRIEGTFQCIFVLQCPHHIVTDQITDQITIPVSLKPIIKIIHCITLKPSSYVDITYLM